MVQKSKSVDVRSKKDVAKLEHDIKIGPITVVLVYADWCGHCTRFKENVWSKLTSEPHPVNLASVHHDQLENTSLKDAKIRGYPSVLVVGKDGKPASFNVEGAETNAMPNADLETLKKIVNADAKTILQEEEQEQEEDPKVLSPPDVRRDIIGGGNLLKTMMRYVSGKTRKAAKKGKKAKKTRRI